MISYHSLTFRKNKKKISIVCHEILTPQAVNPHQMFSSHFHYLRLLLFVLFPRSAIISTIDIKDLGATYIFLKNLEKEMTTTKQKRWGSLTFGNGNLDGERAPMLWGTGSFLRGSTINLIYGYFALTALRTSPGKRLSLRLQVTWNRASCTLLYSPVICTNYRFSFQH